MTDLVEQLRDTTFFIGGRDRFQIADEIERLRADVVILRAAFLRRSDGEDEANNELERLRAELAKERDGRRFSDVLVEEKRAENERLRALHLQAEARCDMLAQQLCADDDIAERLRAVINNNVPKLITVARMPNQEHVADAHNRAVAELLKVTR